MAPPEALLPYTVTAAALAFIGLVLWLTVWLQERLDLLNEEEPDAED